MSNLKLADTQFRTRSIVMQLLDLPCEEYTSYLHDLKTIHANSRITSYKIRDFLEEHYKMLRTLQSVSILSRAKAELAEVLVTVDGKTLEIL